jgi:hypothetical protein
MMLTQPARRDDRSISATVVSRCGSGSSAERVQHPSKAPFARCAEEGGRISSSQFSQADRSRAQSSDKAECDKEGYEVLLPT